MHTYTHTLTLEQNTGTLGAVNLLDILDDLLIEFVYALDAYTNSMNIVSSTFSMIQLNLCVPILLY